MSRVRKGERPEEVGGVFSVGNPRLPGKDGPHPGPWFMLSVSGSVYRGRYIADGVWVTEGGLRFSQLGERTGTVEKTTPEYAALRMRILNELMESRRRYTPNEIAVGLRSHPETDPSEVAILETSETWEEANRRVRHAK